MRLPIRGGAECFASAACCPPPSWWLSGPLSAAAPPPRPLSARRHVAVSEHEVARVGCLPEAGRAGRLRRSPCDIGSWQRPILIGRVRCAFLTLHCCVARPRPPLCCAKAWACCLVTWSRVDRQSNTGPTQGSASYGASACLAPPPPSLQSRSQPSQTLCTPENCHWQPRWHEKDESLPSTKGPYWTGSV